MAADKSLQQAIAAAQSGDRATALQLLQQVVQQEPHNQLAWVWLAFVSPEVESKRHCLEQAQAIDPQSPAGKRAIAGLKSLPSAPASSPASGNGNSLFQHLASSPAPRLAPGSSLFSAFTPSSTPADPSPGASTPPAPSISSTPGTSLFAALPPSQAVSPAPRPAPSAPPPAVPPHSRKEGQRVCVRCGKQIGLLGALRYNKQTGRCGKCEGETQKALLRFRQAFLDFSRDDILSPDEWERLQQTTARERLDMTEALTFVRGDTLHLLERTLTFAFADGILSEKDEQNIRRLQTILMIPDTIARPVLDRLAYLKQITAIRQGKLPTTRPSVHLEAGEMCHFETAATYRKVTARAIIPIVGHLVVTNKNLHFLSGTEGWAIKLKTIMRVTQEYTAINLEVSARRGNGHYEVPDSLLAQAVINTAVRIDKRDILVPQGEANSRHIPHDVRIAVWNRDQGKCVTCGDRSYLEFDHIIPHSKGGANTVNNIQLLCRKCNLAKGNRL